MSATDALQLAAAEGLTLEMTPPGHGRRRELGPKYKGVNHSPYNCASRPYSANIRRTFTTAEGRVCAKKSFLGSFATAEQAALEIARARSS